MIAPPTLIVPAVAHLAPQCEEKGVRLFVHVPTEMHGMPMDMTHYMELLATNQPWNLILFMAIPVILAEYIAITELQLLFTRDMTSGWRTTNRYAGIAAGIYSKVIRRGPCVLAFLLPGAT